MDILGNQVHPRIQTLFPNKDVLFQDDNKPIYTAATLWSWFEKQESGQQSSHLNITEPIWSVFVTRGADSHLQHF
jgi:hypothetical protein